ncbi:hypothetical protein BH11ACT3_BH11ACT3_01710 [soil metagenome]
MAKAIKINPENVPPRVATGFDRVMSVQRPVVLAHIRSIRRRRPNDSPALIIQTLERRYLAAVTTGGAAFGASAAIPAVGTAASLALSGAETAGFLEASALFAQSVTEIHGIAVDEPERARTLVMALMLGSAGQDLIQQFAGQATGKGKGRTAYWGEFVTSSLPTAAFGPIADRIRAAFIRRFAVTQGTSIAGRLIPFGIGAVVGGAGNHLMGRKIVKSSHEAFGPPPAFFPVTLDALPRAPKQPRAPKAPRSPRALRPVAGPRQPRQPRLPRLKPGTPQIPPAPGAGPTPSPGSAPAPPNPDDRRPE